MNFILKTKKHLVWILIVFIVILTSIPGLMRIYNIRYLYFFSAIQDNALASNIAIRNEYGIGATDLKLKKITVAGDKNVFYFDYSYHGMFNSSTDEEKTYIVEFLEDKIVSIIEI